MSPRRRLRDYYRQFEALSPAEDSKRLRARREEEKSAALAEVGELDCSRDEWHDPPDPEVVNAATFALRRGVHRYPDPSVWRAREAVAAHHGLPVERAVLGHGAGPLLQALLRELAAGGDAVLPWPSWGPLPALAARAGVRPVPVPLGAGGTPERAGLVAAVTDATRVVVVCSPNDPTGGLLGREDVRALAAEVGPAVTVIVDEALVELAGEDASCAPLLADVPNLLVLRSFSKAWGLAGLRGGYALGPQGAEDLLAVLEPGQGVAAPTQAAIAAALGDPARAAAFLRRRRSRVGAERERFATLLDGTPFAFPPSHTHHLWLRGEGMTSSSLTDGLAKRRVLVASGAAWGDDAHVRITLGDRPGTERLAAALRAVADGR